LIGNLDTVFGGVGRLGEGRWRASFNFSEPAITHLTLGQVVTFDEYDLTDGSYLGGDEFFNIKSDFEVSGRSGSRVFRVDRRYQSIGQNPFTGGPSITYHNFFGGAELGAHFDSIANPITYEFRADRIGDVPEPASWVLLVTGFGLVGAVQRRRLALA
jgi:hypothetical protein